MISESIWQQFLLIAQEEVGTAVVDTWLKAVSISRWDAIKKTVNIKAPNIFVKEWIQQHYNDLFVTHLKRLFNVDVIKISYSHITEDTSDEVPLNSASGIIPAQRIVHSMNDKKSALVKRMVTKVNHVNRNYTFDSFVVGPSNSLAYAAAHAISDQPGVLYNPLFLYGGSGLGKTHLLHAIGNQIKLKFEQMRVLYQPANRFVNEFISAIRFNKVDQFQAKYRGIDVLLIDDIQFICNKEQTQEAFFHIFNALYESNKQIVFSGDLYPADMNGLAERLRTRMEWGLVADIQIPAIETKIAILKRKAELNNETLSDEVAHFIATLGVSSVRELEGYLIRVIAFASLTKQDITLEIAKKVLLRSKEKKHVAIDFAKVVKGVEQHYCFSIDDLRSQSRNKQLSLARQIAMYLMKKMTNKSLHEIGYFLGRKDHTTVLHAIGKINNLLEKDALLSRQIKRIEKEIRG